MGNSSSYYLKSELANCLKDSVIRCGPLVRKVVRDAVVDDTINEQRTARLEARPGDGEEVAVVYAVEHLTRHNAIEPV